MYRELLQAYYDGSSTPAQEREMLRLLRESGGNDELFTDERLLSAMIELGNEVPEVPEELVPEVLARLEAVQKRSYSPLKPLIYWIGSAAAIGLVLIGSLLFLNRNNELGSYSDPKLAYAEVQTTLAKVSGYLGQGTGQLRVMGKLGVSMQPLENLERFDKVNKNLSLLGKMSPGLQMAEKIITEN